MAQRTKLLLLIPHLGGGGAEQVTALLARSLPRQKYEIHLGLITQDHLAAQASVSQFCLPASVAVHALGVRRVRASVLGLFGLVRQVQPDVILSGMAHLNFFVLLLKPLYRHGTVVLVRQNGSVSAHPGSDTPSLFSRLLYRFLYPRADYVICQSCAMVEEMVAKFAIPRSRLTVLPNPVDVEAIRSQACNHAALWNGAGPHLLAVGRLSHEKGFDLLLEAFAVVLERHPTSELLIVGAGLKEAGLRAQCGELRIEGAVRFAGHVDQPTQYFSGATLFVLSSRHEGMPNALLEAAAGGLPIVALPACGGIVDLLRDQPGTWLASDISAPALTVSLLAALAALQPGKRFAHGFVEPFHLERAIRAYEDAIGAALRERRQ